MAQLLKDLAPDDIGRVVSHPAQLETVDAITRLLYRLRTCSSPLDYRDFQKDLFHQTWQTETRRAAVRRVIKRLRRGDSLPKDAPELASTWPCHELSTWQFEERTHERICRQFRSVGDALAWRVTNFDRQYILTLSRNYSAGPMVGKEGLGWELGQIEYIWKERGHFALLHDLTSCLRIADLTEFTSDGRRMLWEIKKDTDRRDPKQRQRMEAAVRAFNEGARLPGKTDAHLVSVPIDLKAHLDALLGAVRRAEAEGCAALTVPGGRVLTCGSIPTMMATGKGDRWEDFQKVKAAALRRAKIDRANHHIKSHSVDLPARSPVAAPFGIYPLDPRQCAQLICDFLIFEVTMDPAYLVSALARWGLRSEVLLPDLHGELQGEQPVVQILTPERGLTIHAPAMQLVLLELIDVRCFAEGLTHVLAQVESDQSEPVLSFRNEAKTWR